MLLIKNGYIKPMVGEDLPCAVIIFPSPACKCPQGVIK